jgi:hypothetical protein
VALDDSLLVAGLGDNSCRVIHANRGQAGPLFDLSVAENESSFLRGHSGPVFCLDLTSETLTTGSWDTTVRTYCRSRPGGAEEELTLSRTDCYPDWVQALVVRGKHTLVASGSVVHCVDQETGTAISKFDGLHESIINAVEGTRDSRILFTAGSEGLVMSHDLRMKRSSCVLWHHNSSVNSLSLDDPWLASSSSDGTVLLVNTEKAARGMTAQRGLGPNCRLLHSPSNNPAFCVDISDGWVCVGSESDTVKTFDFSKAMVASEKAAAARAAKATARGSGVKKNKGGADLRVNAKATAPSLSETLLGTSPPSLPPLIHELQAKSSKGHRWWRRRKGKVETSRPEHGPEV